jgi:hypothetical protein
MTIEALLVLVCLMTAAAALDLVCFAAFGAWLHEARSHRRRVRRYRHALEDIARMTVHASGDIFVTEAQFARSLARGALLEEDEADPAELERERIRALGAEATAALARERELTEAERWAGR